MARHIVGIIHEVTEVTQIIIPNIHARRAVLPEVMQEQQLIHHRAAAHQAVNKQETVNLYRITAVNQTDNTEEKDRYGIPYMDVNEQYGKFPNGNPEAHTGRGSVNSVGGVNRESLSRTNDLRSADGNKTGAGINNSPSHQNRPPISRNTVVGENRNNVGSVNQEQNASHFNSQRQSSVAGNSPTNVTQRGNSTNNSGTVHNTENVRNGINTVNSSEGQTHSVVNNHNNTTTGGTNNNSHTDNVSRQQTVNNNRQINHEYKNGRYNPAAVNRKQDRTVYHKQTTIKKIDSSDEMKLRKKRGGKNGRTKK